MHDEKVTGQRVEEALYRALGRNSERNQGRVCSFCGKDESGVAKLVAGPAAFICNECVAATIKILRQHGISVD